MSEDTKLVAQAFKFFYTGHYEAAIKTFSELTIRDSTNADWKYWHASALLATNKFDEAKRIVSDLIDAQDGQGLVHGIIGSARISRLELQLALEVYLKNKKPIPLDQLSELRKEFSDIKESIDTTLDKKGKICIPDFYNEYGMILGLEACIELYAETTPAIENLSIERKSEKLFGQAVEKYHNALQIDSAYVPAIHNQGMLYFDWALQLPENERKEKLEKALLFFEESLSKNKDYVESLFDKGIILCHLRRYTESKEPFIRAASLNKKCVTRYVRGLGKTVLKTIGIDNEVKPIIAPIITKI